MKANKIVHVDNQVLVEVEITSADVLQFIHTTDPLNKLSFFKNVVMGMTEKDLAHLDETGEGFPKVPEVTKIVRMAQEELRKCMQS